jgi:hypothetical protein
MLTTFREICYLQMELQSAKNAINLNVLKRHDHSIHTIIDTTSHVVLYDFTQNQWKKRGVEGTLFLYERSKEPKHGFLILNRVGLDNLQVDLKELQIQPSGEYLMYKVQDAVYGLWIFGKDDRERLYFHLEEIMRKPSLQQVTLEEIWSALEGMAPHSSHFLSESEFLARFQILVQSPFFARAMYIGYLQDRNEK